MEQVIRIRGMQVSEAEAASGLGFSSVQTYKSWVAAGRPIGRCCRAACGRPVFWPATACPECGSPAQFDSLHEDTSNGRRNPAGSQETKKVG